MTTRKPPNKDRPVSDAQLRRLIAAGASSRAAGDARLAAAIAHELLIRRQTERARLDSQAEFAALVPRAPLPWALDKKTDEPRIVDAKGHRIAVTCTRRDAVTFGAVVVRAVNAAAGWHSERTL